MEPTDERPEPPTQIKRRIAGVPEVRLGDSRVDALVVCERAGDAVRLFGGLEDDAEGREMTQQILDWRVGIGRRLQAKDGIERQQFICTVAEGLPLLREAERKKPQPPLSLWGCALGVYKLIELIASVVLIIFAIGETIEFLFFYHTPWRQFWAVYLSVFFGIPLALWLAYLLWSRRRQ